MEIRQSAAFAKVYRRLPRHLQTRVNRTVQKLQTTPELPGLRIEIVKLAARNVRSCRVDDGNRLIYEIIEGGSLNLLYIGSHDLAYSHAEATRLVFLPSDITLSEITGGFVTFDNDPFDIEPALDVISQKIDWIESEQELDLTLGSIADIISEYLGPSDSLESAGQGDSTRRAENISVIPYPLGAVRCGDILLVFCLGSDDFNERLRNLVYHAGIYCPDTKLAVMITTQWDEGVWQGDHAHAVSHLPVEFLALLLADGRLTALG